jgi:tryptophanyl-tRNA synthetase
MEVAPKTIPGVASEKPRDDHAEVVYAPRIMAAILPTDQLHWGHYFGGLKYHIHFHHEYPGDCFFAIADYHSLMRGISPERIAKGTLKLATVYLALGLDPNKACLYRQSDVPEITELFWFICCTTSWSYLMRTKETIAAEENAGMLTYPMLMAADILGLRANIVPVGHNQEADLQRVRDMARSFNKAIGHDIFPIPEMIQLNADDIPGTDGRKMLAAHDNLLPLFARPDELRTLIRAMKPSRDPASCPVNKLYSLVAPPAKAQQLQQDLAQGLNATEAKERLVLETLEYFQVFDDRYQLLRDDPDYVRDVLRAGYDLVCDEARETLDEVRTSVGLNS